MKMQFKKRTKDAPKPDKLGIECIRCGDKLFSLHRHDFKPCTCACCFVDGGDDYLRVGGDLSNWKYIRFDGKEIENE